MDISQDFYRFEDKSVILKKVYQNFLHCRI